MLRSRGSIFRNDGAFTVRASYGIAFGVVSGYDATFERSVINTGSIGVSSTYGAIAVQLSFGSAFEIAGLFRPLLRCWQ